MLNLYFDHHVQTAVTDGLRLRGIDVLTAFDDGYSRRSDEELLARATELTRVTVTFDDDLLAIAADWQTTERFFPGLMYGKAHNTSIGNIVTDLELIAHAVSPQEMANSVIWIPL